MCVCVCVRVRVSPPLKSPLEGTLESATHTQRDLCEEEKHLFNKKTR